MFQILTSVNQALVFLATARMNWTITTALATLAIPAWTVKQVCEVWTEPLQLFLLPWLNTGVNCETDMWSINWTITTVLLTLAIPAWTVKQVCGVWTEPLQLFLRPWLYRRELWNRYVKYELNHYNCSCDAGYTGVNCETGMWSVNWTITTVPATLAIPAWTVKQVCEVWDERIIVDCISYMICSFTCLIDPSHKFHNASDKYPIMYHFVSEVQISVTKWCIVGYGTGALWDLYNRYLCCALFWWWQHCMVGS